MVKKIIAYVGIGVVGLVIGLNLGTKDPVIIENTQTVTRDNSILKFLRMEGETKHVSRSLLSLDEILKLPSQFEQMTEAHLLVEHASEEEIMSLIDKALAVNSYADGIALVEVFVSRLAKVNPQRASEFIWRELGAGDSRHMRFARGFYHEWMIMDESAATTDLKQVEFDSLRNQLIAFLLRDDHFINHMELQAYAESLPGDLIKSKEAGEVSRMNPQDAFAYFAAMTNDEEGRMRGLSSAIYRWAQIDPAAAFNNIISMDDFQQKQWLIRTVMRSWSRVNPEEAMLTLSQHADMIGRYGPEVLSSIARDDPQKAMRMADTYQDQLSRNAKNSIIYAWAEKDPKAAIAYVNESGEHMSPEMYSSLASAYVRKDPLAAFEWAKKNGNIEQVSSQLAHTFSYSQPKKAEEYLESMEKGSLRDGLIRAIANRKGQSNPLDALSWLESYKEDAGYNSARSSLISTWAHSDPAAAAGEILNTQNQTQRESQTQMLVSNWYRQNPDSALDWAYQLPQGEQRDMAFKGLIMSSGHSDPDKVSEWLSEISDPKQRESVEPMATRMTSKQSGTPVRSDY